MIYIFRVTYKYTGSKKFDKQIIYSIANNRMQAFEKVLKYAYRNEKMGLEIYQLTLLKVKEQHDLSDGNKEGEY